MHSRKRQAQPLLPTRSPKQPRLASKGYDGGAPSPSATEGIRSRWFSIGKELKVLIGDTLDIMLPSISTSAEVPANGSRAILNNSPPSMFSTPRQHALSAVQSNVASTPQQHGAFPSKDPLDPTPRRTAIPSSFLRPEDIPLPPSPDKSTFLKSSSPPPSTNPLDLTLFSAMPNQSTPKRNAIASGSSTPIPVLERGATSSSLQSSSLDYVLKSSVISGMKNLQLGSSLDSSALSSRASNSSSLFAESQTDIGSQTSRRSSHSSKRDPLRRNIKNREHIFSKVHKASVRRNHLQLREEITRELYDIKRRTGFSSGFSDFKGLLDYQRKLQNIDLENAPPPLRPAASFGAKATPRDRQRLLDIETEEDTQFLQRVLDIAKATLNSPKPPKPFAPTLEQLHLQQRVRDDDIERRIRPPVPPLPSSLPPADEKVVKEILSKRGVVSKFAKEQVSNTDLTRLLPGQWLNDEVINFYGAMLLGRSESSKENPTTKKAKPTQLNIHYFNSFFWTKLTQEGYEKGRLAKWTKRFDIFSKDAILLPVNHGNAHWTAAAINFRAKRFESYDSMGMAKAHVCNHLRKYVNLEHQNKKKKDFDFSGWEDWAPDSTPQQENGYDCGVFTCQFLEALSRGEEAFNFSQKDMPYLRRRMIWEIGSAKLWDDS